jgi:Zn-dependent peptidase ImmA (M78 family)
MEWQAGYICGAILMPVGPLRRLMQTYLERYNLYAPLSVSTQAARELITQVASQFAVSQDAARVRLTKLGSITEQEVGPSLFS